MLSNFGIGILVGLGAGGWAYAKGMKHSGNNYKSGITVAVVVGGIACLVVVIIASMFNHGA